MVVQGMLTTLLLLLRLMIILLGFVEDGPLLRGSMRGESLIRDSSQLHAILADLSLAHALRIAVGILCRTADGGESRMLLLSRAPVLNVCEHSIIISLLFSNRLGKFFK